MPGNDDNDNPNWGKYVGLGLEMAVGVGLGYVVGSWLDRKYGWAPRGVVIGTLVGVAGGMYLLIKTALQLNADPPKAKTRPEARPKQEDRQ